MTIGWQEIVCFSVVFHAVGHLLNTVKSYREQTALARLLRDMSKLEKKIEGESIRRVK